MLGQRIGYIRVSTLDQLVDRQLEGVEVDKTFLDHASGKDTKRPQLALLLSFVRAGDTVIVHILYATFDKTFFLDLLETVCWSPMTGTSWNV
jgi:Resolvase, N terminal domain